MNARSFCLGLALAFTLSFFLGTTTASAHEFTYKNVLIASLKKSASVDYDTLVDSYMEAFRAPTWQKFHDDEFEMDSKRKETIDIMKKEIESFDMNEPFEIATRSEFEDYDFPTQKFRFVPIQQDTFFYVDFCCNNLPHQINVSFDNPSFIDGIPMAKDKAKAFLDSRKNGAYVNRYVHLTFKAVIVSKQDDDALVAHIVSARITDETGGDVIAELK